MPLSCHGLCDAEMTMPAANECARARKATAGVVMTPADSTVAPAAARPAASVAAIQSEDSRGSWPMRTLAGGAGAGGGGDDAGGFDGRSGGGEAGGERGGDPVRGFAGILADENSWWLVSMVPPQMGGDGEAGRAGRWGWE